MREKRGTNYISRWLLPSRPKTKRKWTNTKKKEWPYDRCWRVYCVALAQIQRKNRWSRPEQDYWFSTRLKLHTIFREHRNKRLRPWRRIDFPSLLLHTLIRAPNTSLSPANLNGARRPGSFSCVHTPLNLLVSYAVLRVNDTTLPSASPSTVWTISRLPSSSLIAPWYIGTYFTCAPAHTYWHRSHTPNPRHAIYIYIVWSGREGMKSSGHLS